MSLCLSLSRNQSQKSRSRGADSGHYHRSRRGEGVQTSRSPEEYHIYDRKQRKQYNDDSNSGEKSRLRYDGWSSKRDNDSDRDLPNGRDMEKHRHARESPREHGISEWKGDYEDTRRRARKPVSDWDQSDSDVDREERSDFSHRSSKSRKKVRCDGSRERTGSPVDNSDGDSYHGHRRRRSRSSWSDLKNRSDQTTDLHDRWDPGKE